MPHREAFYITTALPYVNAAPHLGFALELVHADIIARYRTLRGDEVFFNTGTDEHGVKIYRKALEEKKDPQVYVDECAARFQKLKEALDINYTNFIRTTDAAHKAAAQEFWRRCAKNGDIEKKLYKIKYCVGCELEKAESDLEDGRCPIHPNLTIEENEEENYFFKWSRYEKQLLEHYASHPDFVMPEFRFNEIKRFVERGLNDFSISRLKSKMPWGVPVPNDPEHVMYVWFDALVNYISTLGWPKNEKQFEAFWPGVQIAGKDNLRQQSAMWQAMLISAGLPPSKQIWIHGFINSGGHKMSKSMGNVVDPIEIAEKYGTDALRYWIAREANGFEDSDFTWEKFKESYNANLANGLGNLVSRVLTMAKSAGVSFVAQVNKELPKEYIDTLNRFEIQKAADYIWGRITEADAYVQETEPFRTIKTDKERAKKDILHLLDELSLIAQLLVPILPRTSQKISIALESMELPAPLFPRT